MADEEDEPEAVSKDEEEAEVEPKQVDTKDEASSTPQHTLENGKCGNESFDLAETGSSESLSSSSLEKDTLEADAKTTSIEPIVSVKEALAKNGAESGSESSSSSLNGINLRKNICLCLRILNVLKL